MPWKKKIAWSSIFSIIYLTFLVEHTYKIIIIHLLNKQGYANFFIFYLKSTRGKKYSEYLIFHSWVHCAFKSFCSKPNLMG